MNENTQDYYNWILKHTSPSYEIHAISDNEIHLDTDYARATILFYIDPDIAEFTIVNSVSHDTVFYLHFEPEIRSRAEQLFNDLVHSLIAMKENSHIKVLLCCTSGLTTGFFVKKLEEAAKVLNLPYNFSAVSYEELYQVGFSANIILLAPQIGYVEKEVRDAMNDSRVLTVPTEIFASYDTGRMITLIQNTLKKHEPEKSIMDDAMSVMSRNHETVLIISIRIRSLSNFHYCVIDHGKLVLDERVRKYRQALTLEDIEDIIRTVIARGHKLDRIGISTPGTVNEGHVFLPEFTSVEIGLDIPEYIESRYGIKTSVINNMNAAALGCYCMQHTYRDIVLLYQSSQHVGGGAGIIINGQLVTGLNGMAGETKYTLGVIPQLSSSFRIHSQQQALELVVKTLVCIQGTIGTSAVYLASNMTPDMSAVRDEMKKYMAEPYIPELIKVDNLGEYIFCGLFLYTIGVTKQANQD